MCLNFRLGLIRMPGLLIQSDRLRVEATPASSGTATISPKPFRWLQHPGLFFGYSMLFKQSLQCRISFFSVIAFLILVLPGFANGQTERLELGRRLQRFEMAWETADANRRAECVPMMKSAVGSFFGLQLSAAGKHLDQAWQITRGKDSIGGLEKFAVCKQLIVESVCADATQAGIKIRLDPFYQTDATPPDQSRVVVAIVDIDKKAVAQQEFQLADLPTGLTWATGVLPEGDYRLHAEMKSGRESFSYPETAISRIDKLDSRLEALEQSLFGAAGKMDDTVRATIRDTVVLLKAVKVGEVQETGYPALARLKMCEALLQAGTNPCDVIAPLAAQSDVWLSLAKGRSSVPVRLRAPRSLIVPQSKLNNATSASETATSMPVLFLFHGAGGSENMFFETYGAGRVVAEGLNRGWLVVAPRQGLFGLPLDIAEMLDGLEPSFHIDRTKIMLLGHSMGAAQVVRQTSLHPEIPLAAVALGGGNRIADATKLKPIIWFVGAGSEDFGKGGAKQLQKSLASAGVTSTYLEYPNVEHMVIVQAAIDDVFRFLDETLREKKLPAAKE